jgi:hypothetical protein
MPLTTTLGGSIPFGRAATLPLSFVEWSFIFWFARNLKWFSRNSLTKVAGILALLGAVAAVVIGQFWLYIWIAHPKEINDPFLMLVILFESLISVGILLYVLSRPTAQDRTVKR